MYSDTVRSIAKAEHVDDHSALYTLVSIVKRPA